MRKTLAALLLALGVATPTLAEVRVSIGINVPAYPVLHRIPNYPVYYAPSLGANYFFYDGLYWVFDGTDWYASSWYNGPWHFVSRYDVPVYLLRVPVRYYRYAPAHFRSWRADAPPHWHEYWGSTWAQRRAGWDRWDRRSAPAAAPLPVYQRQYTGDRYPRLEQQVAIQQRSYRYEPRDRVAKDVIRERRVLADARGMTQAPGLRRSEGRGPPDHAVARGHVRDERGMPEHSRGKAKGHDRDEGQGRGRGRDKDKDKD
jgi:hypothetical protein